MCGGQGGRVGGGMRAESVLMVMWIVVEDDGDLLLMMLAAGTGSGLRELLHLREPLSRSRVCRSFILGQWRLLMIMQMDVFGVFVYWMLLR